MVSMNQMNLFLVVVFLLLVCAETVLLLPLNLNRKNSWIPIRFLKDGDMMLRARDNYQSLNTKKAMCIMNEMKFEERLTGAFSLLLMVCCSDFLLGMPVPVFFFWDWDTFLKQNIGYIPSKTESIL